jgi:hypothetical protein
MRPDKDLVSLRHFLESAWLPHRPRFPDFQISTGACAPVEWSSCYAVHIDFADGFAERPRCVHYPSTVFQGEFFFPVGPANHSRAPLPTVKTLVLPPPRFPLQGVTSQLFAALRASLEVPRSSGSRVPRQYSSSLIHQVHLLAGSQVFLACKGNRRSPRVRSSPQAQRQW